jgi:WD40 repeat protein/DNA polymerase III delta prime subunit
VSFISNLRQPYWTTKLSDESIHSSRSSTSDEEYSEEKCILGMKRFLRTSISEKKCTSIFVQDTFLGDVEARSSELLCNIRRRLLKKNFENIPSFYCFLYKDGTHISIENEMNTWVSSCLRDNGGIWIDITFDISDEFSTYITVPNFNSEKITSEAEPVVRSCLQFLESRSFKRTFTIDLPDPEKPCYRFLRNLIRSVMSLCNTTGVNWKVLEIKLERLNEMLKIIQRRAEFALLMSYKIDMKNLSDIISEIQEVLDKNSDLSDDDPVFFVRIDSPRRSIKTLLNILSKSSFLDLCGDKHAKTRLYIANFLNISEREVINRIKNKGLPSVIGNGMFRNMHLTRSVEGSYSNRLDREELQKLFAPHIESQESLISVKANCFNKRTFQWAVRDFDTWVNDKSNVHRCFIFSGSPGCGKTTFASYLFRDRPQTFVASHYVRHDDVTTTKAKVMLLSLVYQMCMHFGDFETKIRAIMIVKRLTRKQLLSRDFSNASIFREFLEGPLREMYFRDEVVRCILIEGIELGSIDGGDLNPVLKAVRNFLYFLPPCFRLVITSLPHISILKRLRVFNAKHVQPKECDVKEDFSIFFSDALPVSPIFGDDTMRKALIDSLVAQVDGNYIFATILMSKAKLSEESASLSFFQEYLDLGFNEVLEKDLEFVNHNFCELFWQVVRYSLVAFRALHVSEIVSLMGCSEEALSKLLYSVRNPFLIVTDDSVIRFGQKRIKSWLLDHLRSQSNQNSSGTVTLARSQNCTEIQKLHATFGKSILKLLNMHKSGTLWEISSSATLKEYILRYTVSHLVKGDLKGDARSFILNPIFIIERAVDAEAIIKDMNMISEGDEFLQLVTRAVEMSMKALKYDHRQISSQLVGRLKAATYKGHGSHLVQLEALSFVQSIENQDLGYSWWCPVAPTWDQAERTLLKILKGHHDQVQSVDLHPDGLTCASASWDGSVRIWNILSGGCTAVLLGHQDAVWCVNWSCSGKMIASGGVDSSIRVWDVEARKTLLVLQGHQNCVYALKFSPDSTLLASSSKDGEIRVWDTMSGGCQSILRCSSGFAYSVDWKIQAENQYLCSGGTDNSVCVWDLLSSSCILVCLGHEDWVRSVFWSLDGRNIFSGSSDHTVLCWDALTGECDQVLMGHSGGIWSVVQSNDGRYLYSASADGTIKTWECCSWKCDQTFKGHEGPVLSISLTSDGSKIISSGTDTTLIEWDCKVKRSKGFMDGHCKPVWGVDVTPDFKFILSASSDCTARLWNVSTGLVERVFSGHTAPVWSAKFSNSTRFIATASSDHTVAIYRLSTGGRKFILAHSDYVWDIVWSIEDAHLFTASRDRAIRGWNTKTGECDILLTGHLKEVKSLSISPNGIRLASASPDVTIRIWNLANKSCEKVLQRKEAGAITIEWVDDTVVTAGYTSGCVRLWNVETGARLVGFLPGHKRRACSVSVSPDCQRIISVSTDKEIRIWNIGLEKCERRIILATGLGAYCVKWAPDGEHFITGGADRSIQIWKSSTGRCERVFGGDQSLGIYDVSWSPCGNFVASGSRDRNVQIWDAVTGQCIATFAGHTNWVHSVDWECNGRQVISRSDDGTARIWNVHEGSCERICNESWIPEDFNVFECNSTIVNLTGSSMDGYPVGVEFQKVRIRGDRCCGWTGNMVYFFRLQRSQNDTQSRGLDCTEAGDSTYMVRLKE